jgi:hypothetical protein
MGGDPISLRGDSSTCHSDGIPDASGSASSLHNSVVCHSSFMVTCDSILFDHALHLIQGCESIKPDTAQLPRF